MDGTLGSQTAWMLDGSGVVITSGEELAEIVRAGAEAGWPVGVHAIGDRANREALDAFERTRDALAAARAAPADRARAVPRAGGRRRASRELGVAVSVQFTPRALRRAISPKRFWPDKLDGHVLVPLARSTPARSSRTAPTRRSRSSTRGPASSPASSDHWRERPAAHARAGAARDVRRAGLALARRAHARHARPRPLADLVVLDRDPFACEPEELPEVQVVATMVAGRWVHNPPPWD